MKSLAEKVLQIVTDHERLIVKTHGLNSTSWLIEDADLNEMEELAAKVSETVRYSNYGNKYRMLISNSNYFIHINSTVQELDLA